ncbi:LacI family transcription regulator [Bifidobacterium biavatii DSM 23969]|uniref:LacI family transcription regulator n=1 Tax=Bifidobacterium biavatii DSM 23969 TaxID=1437608 RepID=A0A087A1K9_9BIFI|nr:LacI family transcription regulator [Bifidobacterium biavatii DSM 23969]
MANSKPTLRDVAAAAGVSPMTASNALHGKAGVKESTRAKVLAAAEQLDYRINLTASMLKSGRSNIIHIIVNEFDSPFYSKLVQALATATTERGLTPFVEQTSYSPTAAERALTRNPFSDQLFDGEIIHASGLGTNLPLARMNAGRPLVLIDGCEETPSVDTVNFPNEEGARAAVQHLIERGCRRIAIVGGEFVPRATLAHVEHSYGLRLRGASGALLDAGLAYDESIMFYGYNSDYGIKLVMRSATRSSRPGATRPRRPIRPAMTPNRRRPPMRRLTVCSARTTMRRSV